MNNNSLARQICSIENNTSEGKNILKRLKNYKRKAVILGITGSPGCGKSTLIDCLISEYRKKNKKIGVLLVDPSSPKTGGALLGDRIRMQSHAVDKDVFIRSFATRGCVGGLCKAIEGAVKVLAQAGFELIIVETVGSGQNETDISKIAALVILVATADAVDDIQLMKAGILEVADILVINKQDLNSQVCKGHLESILNIPVLTTSATEKIGIAELVKTIDKIKNA
jgi:LAO/AO transport system kinase